MLKEQVLGLLNDVFKEDPSLFLLELTVTADNQIRIILDGDHGVSLKDCMKVSRAVEHNLDREEVDFSLEVSSAGATTPLLLPRQYRKNIGRKLTIRAGARTYEGKLTAVGDQAITLEWKDRQPKPVGKGKVTVQNKQDIALADIEEAKVVLKF